MLKRNLFLFFILIAGMTSLNNIHAQELPMSKRLANTIMERSPDYYRDGSKTWDYVIGTVLYGFEKLYDKTSNETYKNYIQKSVDREVNSDGSFKSYKESDYNSDQVREGNAVLFMYDQTGSEKYHTAANKLRLQIADHPRTSDGGFWHKKSYPYQMWLDGLYMMEPFYARYTATFNDTASLDFDDVAHQFIILEEHACDTITGLIYHGWDEQKVQVWADPETGLSSCFWGRAMGWYSMALVDVLDYFPQDNPNRDKLIAIFQRLMTALVNFQEPNSGCWYQVVDYTTPGYGPENGNYLEASATSMFVYSLLKGVRMGYLDQSFLAAGEKGYEGILSEFVTETNGQINLNRICRSAGLGGSSNRMGDFDYYMSEPIVSNDGKGVGPFLGASIQYEALKTTGIAETQISNAARLFPNPARNQFTIAGLDAASDQVQVFNADGSQVLNFISTKKGAIHIDCNSWQSGVYFVRVKKPERTQTLKLVVR
ncbi:MAG TPA: glycoside hydrolase family 88 protein [Sunxiuqinia sp.]|nr:glycoside hydrolase family 88 protein [Sunxiuqinia sp.]